METVRQWAFSVCTSMVACGIALQIMPKSNLSNVFRLVVSVFFLCCLISPVIIRFPHERIVIEEYSASLIEEKAGRLRAVMDEQAQSQGRLNAEEIVADKLRQMGIKHHSITININTSGQSETAASVDIVLDKSHEPQHDMIAARLESALQMDVRLGYE